MTKRRRRASSSNGGLAVVMVLVAGGVAWYVNRPPESLEFAGGEQAIRDTGEAVATPEEAPEPVARSFDDDAPAAPAPVETEARPSAPAAVVTSPAQTDVAHAAGESAPATPASTKPDAGLDGRTKTSQAETNPADTGDDSTFAGHFANRKGLGGVIDTEAIRKRLGLDLVDESRITRAKPGADVDELDVELSTLRARFEMEPTDVAALTALVEALVARDRPDDAWTFVETFGRAGGDVEVGRRFVLQLDPLVDTRIAAMAAVTERGIERAAWAREHSLALNAQRDLESAAAFRDILAPGPDGDTAARSRVDGHATLAAARAAELERLHSTRSALAALAAAGAPLPDHFAAQPGLGPDELEKRDTSASAKGRPHEQRSTRLHVETTVGSLAAWGARRVAEEVRRHADKALRGKNFRSVKGTLEVFVTPSESEFHTERTKATDLIPPWRAAFYDSAAHRVVALDPRTRGEPLALLWGRLAREVARPSVRRVAGNDGVLAPWIEEALAMSYESTRLLGNGDVAFGGWPVDRRHKMALAATGRGESMMAIDEVLDVDLADPRAPVWIWALATFLREQENAEGEKLWSERFDNLIDEERSAGRTAEDVRAPGAMAREFRRVVIQPDDPIDSISSLRSFGTAWHAWVREQAAWATGDAAALDMLVQTGEELLRERRVERAGELVARVLSVDPVRIRAHALAALLAEGDGRSDAALLFARNIAMLQARVGEPLPTARLASLDERFAGLLSEHDAELRPRLEKLVTDYLAQGFPRAAMRLIDRALFAEPLDAAWRSSRATILETLGSDLLFARRRLPIVTTLDSALGDKGLWQPNGTALIVRCSDRKAPTLLNSVAHLREPWRLSAKIRFQPGPDGRLVDERSNFVGFTFGGSNPLSDGEWGIFVSPAGRIELAKKGNLEWPSEGMGHAVRRDDPAILLEVHVENGRFTVFADGEGFPPRLLGNKPADGWMSLFARDVDAEITDIVLRRPVSPDPTEVWHTAPGSP